MKKTFSARLFSLLMAAIMILSAAPLGSFCITASAAAKEEKISATFIVKDQNGASVRSKADSGARVVKVLPYQSVVTVSAKKTVSDKTWYKIKTSQWVYSGQLVSTHTIKYDGTGAEKVPAAKVYADKAKVKVSSEKPVRPGYIFKGWATSKDSTKVSYNPGAAYTGNKNITLYAVWSKCSGHTYKNEVCTKCGFKYQYAEESFKATFIVSGKNGAQIKIEPNSSAKQVKTLSKGSVIDVTAKTKNAAGSTWYKIKNGQWAYSGQLVRAYNIKYNANGGTNAPKTTTFEKDKSAKITSDVPKKSQYIFKGWATSASSKTVSYKAGNTYAKNESITLYAVWEKCANHTFKNDVCTKCGYKYTYTTTSFNALVGNSSKSVKIYSNHDVNSSVYKTLEPKKLATVKFKTKDPNGAVWYKTSDSKWIKADDVSLYYKITFNANGGKNAPSAVNYKSGSTYKVTSSKPTKEGYIFKGWGTTASSKTATYTAGSSMTVTKAVTLYAVWEKCTSHTYKNGVCTKCGLKSEAKVETFNAKFGAKNSGGIRVYGDYDTSSQVIKTIDNNKVISCSKKATASDGSVWYYVTNSSGWIKASDAVRLYYIAYDTDGGSTAPKTTYFKTGSSAKITSSVPTKAGYTFMGWASSKGSSTVSYRAGDVYSTKKSITLYAVWQ